MKRRVGDLLGFFLIMQSVVTFYYSLTITNDLIKYIGIIGSSGVFLVELIFLYYTFNKNG